MNAGSQHHHDRDIAFRAGGELLYEFDPRLIERGTEPVLARMRRAATKVLTGGFKAWIVVMLVGYLSFSWCS